MDHSAAPTPIDLDAVLAAGGYEPAPIKVAQHPWRDRGRRWWAAIKRWLGMALSAAPTAAIGLALAAILFWFGFTLWLLGVIA